ncbi:MAG: NlpC/P60 family protein [Gemmiger sp.]|uniref:C40 family peptidase n=1 Tax=Gemmiger sp. TaxID=2049027 RepID=UPI002E776150|nr:NlpC/P60 family protein [Gemmiger sp.]MEE0709883.1 NlpC/P60 family protein [Gemmiger sp.]
MKRKRNIYDADDAAKSKRLHFSAEERAAHAEKKAEILGEKLEKAKADLPKKRRTRINREFDAMTGKVRHSLSFEDEVKPRSRKNPVARAGLKAGRTVDLAAHSKIRQVEKENVGTEAAHKTEFAAENLAAGAIRKGYRSVKDAPYRKVEWLEVKSAKATVNANYHAAVRDNPELQKHSLSALFQKRKLKREYAKAYREARKTGSRGAAVAKKAKEAVSNAGQAAVALVKNNKGVLVIVGGVALLFILLFSSLSSCSVSMEGAMGAVLGTSYTSEDPDILQVEDNYIALEQELERRMANIESEFSGYDEYQYDVDTIGHDPNELISYLTAKFNAFTPAQVQAELEALFNQQYTLTTREEVQIRYRTVTWTDEEGNEHESEEAYEYYILHVTLRNHSLGTVAVENLTEDEKGRYAAILELKGNKPYLFEDNIYANPSEGEHYEIPGEALSDPSFAALITEAEKYLGYPYVWGGSNPSTSFDCSGFVCWVFTNSGVHNLPRTTAQGIYNQCAIISSSEAKPGDIIFFTGTYDSAGPVSHVGIYVGDGMMIHCGSPIQYANINTSYWQQHFYAIGRL